jgi:hypothetical protein
MMAKVPPFPYENGTVLSKTNMSGFHSLKDIRPRDAKQWLQSLSEVFCEADPSKICLALQNISILDLQDFLGRGIYIRVFRIPLKYVFRSLCTKAFYDKVPWGCP